MCREIMSKSRVIYTVEELRLEKIHAKLLTDTMEVYRDIANDNVFTILENFVTCKNDYMYALTNESFSRKDKAKK